MARSVAVNDDPERSLPWLSFTLAGLMVALFATFGPAPEAWVYDRAAIAAGEWWRLFSGHWVHSDTGHLLWNLGALLLLGSIVESRSRPALIAGLAAGALGVDGLLWFALPELSHYCGLSGALNAVLLLALFAVWRGSSSAVPVLIGVLSLAKIVLELISRQALFTHTAWASVPEAHLAGWLVGLALVIDWHLPRRCKIGYRTGRMMRLFRYRF